ncbi:uncharacterized protein LOC135371569 [Ornithodoros turicata]|uniref:uncharacterized protein LOC135371569 n=1 Tax=Ornithodoros turicata TaxID=34597 RepID=UPI0031388BA2
MGPGNRSMWQYFKVNSGKHSRIANIAQHPSFGNRQLLMLHEDDVKRHNLPGSVITLDPIKHLARFQEESTFKLAPKIRKEVADPNHFDKMKVSNAMSIFSHSTAVALRTMVEEHGWPEQTLVTAWFIDQVNHWFDLMCSRHPVMALSRHNTAKYEEALKFLQVFMDMFSRLKIGNGHYKPCQAGVLLSTTSMLELQKHLLEDLHFDFLLTSRFTQDSLENFFSTVRHRNPIPTPLEFKMSLKIISISQYLKVSTTGSYEVDDGTFFLADFNTSKENQAPQPSTDPDNLLYGKPHLTKAEESAFFCYCGYIVSRVLKNNVTCRECESGLTEKPSSTSGVHSFTTSKCFKEGALTYPSPAVYDMLLLCENVFIKTIGSCMDKDNILCTLHSAMLTAAKHVPLTNCHGVKDKIIRRFCHARLQLHLSDLSRQINTKVRDMGSKSMCAPRRQK